MSRFNLVYRTLLCFSFAYLTPNFLISQSLVINEFMASNSSTILDESGAYDDWVEIHNPSDSAIDMAGMFLTDDLLEPAKCQIPSGFPDSTTIEANGYKLFWFDKESEQGPLHINAKLKAAGEQIGLYASDTSVIDTLSFGVQSADISYGRIPDSTEWAYFTVTTPGSANYTPLPTAAVPLFSYNNGIFSGPITLDLFTTTPGTNIYYTTDGSMATETSILYQNPIAIDSTTSIRAIATGPNNSPSKNVTRMYLIDDYHTFPIVYLTFDPFDFYDPTTGIYVNYLENWERPASLAFFEKDGSLAFNQPADVEVQGTGSAAFPHKSIGIKAANFNGEALFDFPIFPELPYDKYGSFTLRNSGQDWDKTIFRDAYATSLVSDLSDVGSIIGSPTIYLQSYRPTIAYFNGEYRGIYNIRERLDKRYIKTHFDLDEDEYDFIKDLDEVKSGDLDEWYDYLDFILATDMNVQTNFDSLQSIMDVDEYIDYITFNIYLNNTDWPANNNRRWKEKGENGKWRWMVYDLDYTFSLYNSDGSWNSGDYSDNALSRLYNDSGWEWPNPEWSTRPFRACVQNDAWRTQFINRMADQLNVLFTPDRLNVRLQEFIDRYEPEIEEHQCKWFDCYDDWDQDISKLQNFIGGRTNVVRTHFVEKYAEITDTITVGISASPMQGGTIEFSSLTLDHDYFPWQGVYFKGVDIPVKAIPADGYEFIGWSDASLGSNPETSVNITSTTYNLIANFQLIVGLNELAQNANVSVSPNPTSDVIHIQSELLEGQPVTINLVDITGKIVYYKEISAFPQGHHTIGAAHFPKGTYSLNITNQEGIKLVTSVIIQ